MESTKSVKEFLSEKGDLHDCRIRHLAWSLEPNRLEISVADFNSNFLGLPEYSGAQAGSLIFDNVLSFEADVVLSDNILWIYESSFYIKEGLPVIEFLFSPSGKLVICSQTLKIELFLDD